MAEFDSPMRRRRRVLFCRVGVLLLAALAILLLGPAGMLQWDTQGAPTADRPTLGAFTSGSEGTEEPGGELLARSQLDLVAEGKVTFAGRAVAAETGLPLAGVSVRVAPSWTGAPAEWGVPEPVVTGLDGVFRLSCEPLTVLEVQLEAVGRASMSGAWWQLRPGVVADAGDVPLALGTEARFRVVDQDERPVEGISVRPIEPDSAPTSANRVFRPLRPSELRTDDTGTVPTRVLWPGVWQLWPMNTGTLAHRFLGRPTSTCRRGIHPRT